jgi:hypothetical protein
MTEADLVAALDRIAGRARPARLPDDLWARGRRRHRRRLAIGASVAAVVVALVVLVAGPALPGPFGHRAVAPADRDPAVPSEVGRPWPWQPTVAEAPPGPAAVLVDGIGPFAEFTPTSHDQRSLAVGVNGAYRVIRNDDGELLLSPDGRYVASRSTMEETPDWDHFGTSILDLNTGRVRTFGEMSPVAWSPDGRTLLARITSAGNRLVLLDTTTGAVRPLFDLVGRVPEDFAAFSPDGRSRSDCNAAWPVRAHGGTTAPSPCGSWTGVTRRVTPPPATPGG